MQEELSMDQDFIKKLNSILEVNLENDQFGVKELAEEAGISRSQLHRNLKSINGKSPSQFIREFRLEKAMFMLQNNVATASEIAYRVGFSSPTYFNTSFREYYGYPPGEVKFRNPISNNQNEELSNSSNKKIDSRNKLLKPSNILIASIGIIILIVFSYYFSMDSKKNSVFETSEIVINDKSIAVLPFKNWSGDPDLEYVCDGMTDAVISRLAKVKSISKVIPFTSMQKYKETNKGILEIAREQGVTQILQGSLQISGEELKIKLQLIDALKGDEFWSDEYSGDWKSDEIFKIQAEVAENVAKVMNAEITNTEYLAIQKNPTDNNEAYNLFLLAKYQVNKGNEMAFNNAIQLYEKAIALDSSFADAYTGLAQVWMLGGLIWGIYTEQEAWGKTKSSLQKAIKLDSLNLNISDQLYGGYFYYNWDFEALEKYLIRRKDLPYFNKLRQNNFSDFLIKTGRFNEVFILSNERTQIDPLESWVYILKAISLFYLDRKKESHEIITSFAPMFIDDMDYTREAAKLYYYLEDYENSKKQLTLMMNNFPDRPPIILWLSAIHAELEGHSEKIEKYLDALIERYNNEASGSPAWFMALYYCHIKEYENAFVWLQRSYSRHEVEMTWLREEPLLIPLRNDKRYKMLYNKVGFPSIE